MRPMFAGLDRYIATCRTAKHRVFGFLDSAILPDAKLIAIGVDEAWQLSVLSSRIHVGWSVAAGGWLGVGNDSNYNHAQCFNPFPFPDCTPDQKARLAGLGERLDAHRRERQAAHPKLTLTDMYNVLEKLRAGEAFEGQDKQTYDQGLIGILRDLHDQIDGAVAEAYGWPADLSDEEILIRLVHLNRERVAEEAAGHVRWLRPEYQNPTGEAVATKDTGTLDLGDVETGAHIFDWPKALPLQVAFVRNALTELGEGNTEAVARCFKGAKRKTVGDILESLASLGHVRQTGPDQFAA
mgnify:FL=1